MLLGLNLKPRPANAATFKFCLETHFLALSAPYDSMHERSFARAGLVAGSRWQLVPAALGVLVEIMGVSLGWEAARQGGGG